MVHALFGANAVNIFKLFKFFLTLQDPMVNVPSRKRAPNNKDDHFFSHLIQFSTEAFEPGRNISSDKQDTSFQWHHEDKQRATLNGAEDGFPNQCTLLGWLHH